MKSKHIAPRSIRAWLVLGATIALSVAGISLIAQTVQTSAPKAAGSKAAPKSAASTSSSAAPKTASPRRIEVLFLGADTPEHSSQKASALLVPAVAREGRQCFLDGSG